MSIVVIIVAIIIVLILLLVFSLGFFLGLGRKKKDLKRLEKLQIEQEKTQRNILHHFLYKKEGDFEDSESDIYPVKIINRGYNRVKKYLKIKKFINRIGKLTSTQYIEKYFLSYIGIAVFVFGFGYFVKYAVNSAYINIAGRFFISIVVSSFLILLSYSFKGKYKTFSSILFGGAIGLLYIVFTISFYNYKIFSTFQILLIYFLLTAFSVTISLIYNRFELIFLAIIAGFSAPLISGIDYNNFSIILIYLILLNIGGFVIAIFNKNVNIRLFFSIFSGIYMFMWVHNSQLTHNYTDFGNGFILITIIYFLMIAIAVGNSIIYRVSDNNPYEYTLTFAINIIYYSVAIYLIDIINPAYKGAFTALMVIFNLFFLITTLLRKGVSINLTYLFAMISVLFVSLITPVQFVGKTITMIWAIESVLILWFALKVDVKVLKFVSFVLIVEFVVSLVMDFSQSYTEISQNAANKILFFNENFISGIIASIAFFTNTYLFNKTDDKFVFKPLKISWFKPLLLLLGVITLYFTFYIEFLYKFTIIEKNENVLSLYTGIYNFIYLLIANIVFLFIKNKNIKYLSVITAILSSVLFFSYYFYKIIIIRELLLNDFLIPYNKFLIHLLLVSILLFIIYLSYVNIKSVKTKVRKFYKWIVVFLIIAILSTEINHFMAIYYNDGSPVGTIISKSYYFPYSLFWMISALYISITSLIFKDKELIRIAMFIIIISLLKMLIFDFSRISLGERTLSFILAGFILLFIAYVRQKLFEKIEINKKLN